MPWYGDYAMAGWANDNTAETWKTVMNNEFVITLEDMPGWDKYIMEKPLSIGNKMNRAKTYDNSLVKKQLFDLNGKHVKRNNQNRFKMFLTK